MLKRKFDGFNYEYLSNNKKICINTLRTKTYDYGSIQEPDQVHVPIPSDLLSTNEIHCINAIPSGSQVDERIGRRVKITHIMLNYMISYVYEHNEDNNRLYSNAVRALVVYDRQSNLSTPPNLTALLKSGDISSDPIDYGSQFTSFFNLDNMSRFKVLLDKTIVFNPDVIRQTDNTFFLQKSYNLQETLEVDLDTVFGNRIEYPDSRQITTGAIYVALLAQHNDLYNYTFVENRTHRIHYTDN